MLIFTKIPDLQAVLRDFRARHQSIGFVPTMGALHKGHISLLENARRQCSVVICSVFVNPTQFNDKKDLERYPRMPESDEKMLREAGCDMLFMPSVEEIYPNQEKSEYDFGHIGNILEGKSRPGHFNGVAQVVKRFFEIIEPDKAYFGSKDFQQVLIVKQLIKKMNSGIKIVACPTLREADGLAMSSRNSLLNEAERKSAAEIPRMMREAAIIAKKAGVADQAKDFIAETVSKTPLLKLDYYAICDPETLQPLSSIDPQQPAVSLIAVYAGNIRLIDNLRVT